MIKNYVSKHEEEDEYKKIDAFVKTRGTISYKNTSLSSKMKNKLNDINEFSKEGNAYSNNEDKKSDLCSDIKLKIEQNNDSIINTGSLEEDVKTSDYKITDDLSDTNNSKNFYEGENKEVHTIFGEKIEEQTESLKKFSLFGNFSSWKLFKVIVKSGDDLRQEQFATQLINEFNQIFHLENVKIWLNPYEILSTGHNVGIIECVPNAISLDYLKRKAKNFSTLSQFFQQYFGDPTKESND